MSLNSIHIIQLQIKIVGIKAIYRNSNYHKTVYFTHILYIIQITNKKKKIEGTFK